ncbi:serpin H1 [Solea senegalensis]|uniref:Serpin H1 n=1 Tax=Solea senegalensis TaxID=28829 RepID=A0AAV6Q2K7_SOLSE|nr:serpin H1 [Solea senegalensis]
MWMTNVVALCLLALVASAEDKKLSGYATTLADNSANLAFSLYHNMAKEKDTENILISPVVVASSLGLVALGGKASTASQVKTVLSADRLKDEHLHTGLSELLSEVTDAKTRNTTWKINNRLYGPSSVSFADDFVKNSKKHYNYDHSKINLRDKRSAVNSINEWAAKSTGGKLPEITKDVENPDGATIVNAMFFKPHWDEKFHEKMVDNRGFLVTRSFTVGIPMMHRTGLYDFYDDTENRIYVLNMPLGQKQASMFFIMPYHLEPLDRLEKLLTRKQVDTWLSKMENRAVAISLPKVSLEVSHNLQVNGGNLVFNRSPKHRYMQTSTEPCLLRKSILFFSRNTWLSSVSLKLWTKPRPTCLTSLERRTCTSPMSSTRQPWSWTLQEILLTPASSAARS